MSHSRHHHKHHKRSHTHREHAKRIPVLPTIPETPEPKERLQSRSEAYSDANRFFHQNTLKTQGATQTTTVTLTVNEPQKDCLTSCFSGLGKCAGKGKT